MSNNKKSHNSQARKLSMAKLTWKYKQHLDSYTHKYIYAYSPKVVKKEYV